MGDDDTVGRRRPRLAAGVLGVALLVAPGVGCGSTATTREQSQAPPLSVSPLTDVTLRGAASIQLATSRPGVPDVGVFLDDAGLLVLRVGVRSTASTPVLLTLHAALFDRASERVSSAEGSALDVAPGALAEVQLTGSAPVVPATGRRTTISSVVLTATAAPVPTPPPTG